MEVAGTCTTIDIQVMVVVHRWRITCKSSFMVVPSKSATRTAVGILLPPSTTVSLPFAVSSPFVEVLSVMLGDFGRGGLRVRRREEEDKWWLRRTEGGGHRGKKRTIKVAMVSMVKNDRESLFFLLRETGVKPI